MFSAFKRLTGKTDTPSGVSTMPPGHQTMSTQLQRKFARGVQYNMKVIIKGDRNVGKTCLFNRLQGKKFIEEYIPTDEIQVTSIQWNYKATDDIVKVEVWDVVDRGKKKRRFEGLKLDNTQISEETALDAEFLDVYKGTNGVILMMDITKSWTFDYVQNELLKVPEHIPVIVLANHCDMAHHRTVTKTQISFFIENIQGRASQVRYTESSMRNGFGLKLLHKFFNLPFLQLQRVSLMRQLERNQSEIDLTSQELDMYFESDEANYDKFIDQLVNKRRQMAEQNAPKITTDTLIDNNSVGNYELRSASTTSIFIGAGHPIPTSGQKSNSSVDISKLSQVDSTQTVANSKSIDFKQIQLESNFMSKLFGNKQLQTSAATKSQSANDIRKSDITKLSSDLNTIVSVDEFCPEGGQIDKSFLDDVDTGEKCTYEALDSDSDGETENPLVAGYQDDFIVDETLTVNTPTNLTHFKTINDDESNDNSINNNLQSKSYSNNDTAYNSEIEHNDYCNSVPNSDAISKWLSTDSKWRRSPEGGEDTSNTGQNLDFSGSSMTNDDTGSITSFNVNASLLDSSRNYTNLSDEKTSTKKDKKKSSDYKSDKKHKNKKTDKDKESTTSRDKEKKKSKKKRSRDETSDRHRQTKRDELEEFLNGPDTHSVDAAYEAF